MNFEFDRYVAKAGRVAIPLSAIVVLAFVTAVHAQTWKPEKPIDIIIGTTPGGPQDRQGRLIQRIFQERKLIEQSVSVSNRPGGGGAVALAFMAQHKGDPHYMQVVAQPLISNHVAGRSKQHFSDFSPLAIFAVEYVTLVVRTDSPIKDAREFIDNMRKNPAAYAVAIGTTIGNATHSSYAHAMKAAGVDIKRMRTVAFNSGAESMTAVMGGHIDAAAGSVSTVLAQVRAGKLRIIALGAPQQRQRNLFLRPSQRRRRTRRTQYARREAGYETGGKGHAIGNSKSVGRASRTRYPLERRAVRTHKTSWG